MLRLTPKEIKAARDRLGMSQAQFAEAFHLNVRTLQAWEIGNGKPGGPAAVLMWLICRAPEAILKLLKGAG
jgi:putative transcriptional regulator